jgi:hypothetical protein
MLYVNCVTVKGPLKKWFQNDEAYKLLGFVWHAVLHIHFTSLVQNLSRDPRLWIEAQGYR